jgi:hypothetical protein
MESHFFLESQRLLWQSLVALFVCLDFTSHRHSICHMATFQLYWWRKTSGTLPCIILGTNGQLSRTTNVPYASWIASSHERIQSPCRDSNPQRWGASGLKSTTLTTRPRTPLSLVAPEKKWLLWKSPPALGLGTYYGKSMVAMEVTGCWGSHCFLCKVNGCYISNWFLRKVNGCYGKLMVAK